MTRTTIATAVWCLALAACGKSGDPDHRAAPAPPVPAVFDGGHAIDRTADPVPAADPLPSADPVPTATPRPADEQRDRSQVGHGPGLGPSISRARLSRPAVVGSLASEIVTRYLRRRLPPMKNCYEQRLRADRELAGEVAVGFEIDRVGQVTKASASGVSAEVAACVQQQVAGIRFPPDSDGVVKVTFTITFQPRDD